ncbi:MAG: hypothetical protein AAF942_15520, partial [Pseudomonadota bacterium]
VAASSFGFVANVPSSTVQLLTPGLVLALFVYALTIIEAKDPLTVRRALSAFGRGRLGEAASIAPLGLLTIFIYLVVQIIAILLIAFVGDVGSIRIAGIPLSGFSLNLALALFLFLIRDISLVWICVFSRDAKMAEAYGLVAWFILYGPIPIILVVGISRELLPVFYPVGLWGWELSVLPVLVETLLCLILLVWRWKSFWRQGGPKRPAAKTKTPSSTDGGADASPNTAP